MCIYGMEGPGGYQLFGRTIQVWNSWRRPPAFAAGTPWLLRCFDQIRFFPVSHAELTEARAAFPHGAYPIRIEETLGIAVSGLSGCLVIAFFLKYLQRHTLRFFIYYRLIFGIMVIALALFRRPAG